MVILDNDHTDAKLLRVLLVALPLAFAPTFVLSVWLGSGAPPRASASTVSLMIGAAGALGAVYSAIAVARLVMVRRNERLRRQANGAV